MSQKNKRDSALVHTQRSVVITGILFALFIFIDPPVTMLGWILSGGIALFIVYILFQIFLLNKTPKS